MKKLIEDVKKDIKNKSYMIFLIPLIIVAIMFCIIIGIGITKFDNYMLGQISKLVNYNLTVFMGIITSMCEPIVLLYIALLCLVIFKNKRISIGVTFCLVFTGISNFVLKAIFSRQRPLEYMLIDESGYSFPSGHSMVSIAFYGFLIYIGYKLIKKKWVKITYITMLSLLIATIAFSRLYLGVHYPTDVLAGLTIGYILLYVYIKLFESKIFLKEKDLVQ